MQCFKKISIIFTIYLFLSPTIIFGEINDLNQSTFVNEDAFNHTIESLKEKLKDGIPELNIPPMDPFDLAELPIVLNITEIKSDLLFTNIVLMGLTDFHAYNIEIDRETLNLKVGFKLNQLKGFFHYNGSLTLFTFIPIYGKGTGYVELNGYSVDVDINFKTTEDGEYLRTDDVKMQFKLDSCNFQFSGLLNNEDASKLISKFVTDMVPVFIEDHQKWMTNTYSPILAAVINMFNIEVSNVFGENNNNNNPTSATTIVM